jgi:aspartokinase
MVGAAGNGRAGAVTGVAIEENIVLLRTTEMEPGKLSLLLDALHKCGIAPSGIVLEQVRIPGNEKSGTFLSMTVSLENIHDYLSMKERLIAMADGGFSTREGLSTVSLVGNGIGEDCSIIGRLVRLAADSGSELISTSISHSRITALVDGGTARNLLAECHGAFIEGDARKAG